MKGGNEVSGANAVTLCSNGKIALLRKKKKLECDGKPSHSIKILIVTITYFRLRKYNSPAAPRTSSAHVDGSGTDGSST